MLDWSPVPFLRIAAAFIAGIAAYLYLGQAWGGSAWPWALALLLVYGAAVYLAQRRRGTAATDVAGVLGLLAVAALGFARIQSITQSGWPDHLGGLVPRIECYRAVVDEPPVVRAKTFATTLRVQAVRVAGRWQAASGGVRVSLPRLETGAMVAAPRYGEVWLVRGTPEASKGPANLGEFDYRRYLQYHQVFYTMFNNALNALFENKPPVL